MQSSFQCHRCGTNNQIGVPVCLKCGAVFQYSCPSCQSPIKSGDPVCYRCGYTLSWPSAVASDKAPARPAKQNQNKQQKKGDGSLSLFFVGMVLLLGIVAGGVYVFTQLNEKPAAPVIVDNKTTERKQDTVVLDNQPPLISNIKVQNITGNMVEITWTTDEESTSQVIWHILKGDTNLTPPKDALLLQHSVELTGLKTNSTYYYQVRSVDKFKNESTSDEMSFGIGEQPGITKVELGMHTMSIEEQPSGTRTYIRGQVINNGDLPVKLKDIQILININIPGKAGSGEILAALDPWPEAIEPGNTHKFVATVPNGTNPDYNIMLKINNQ